MNFDLSSGYLRMHFSAKKISKEIEPKNRSQDLIAKVQVPCTNAINSHFRAVKSYFVLLSDQTCRYAEQNIF